MSANSSVFLLDDGAGEVMRGLSSSPKRLPSRLFYDAEGSVIFEEITELPEYYLTSTEQGIFERHAEEMVRATGECGTIVELGAGTARKTMLILRAACQEQSMVHFVPVDVSEAALEVAFERVHSQLPQVQVHPLVLDYTREAATLAELPGPKLVLYIGSSIGNFEPMAACALLRSLHKAMAPGDAMLLGTDMRKDREVLLRAYDDSEGVTARFNRNMLARLNREYGANFDPRLFAHSVLWNEDESRIEMHLRSLRRQRVSLRLLGLEIEFAEGESIHTENSYKFSAQGIEWMAQETGFTLERQWTDAKGWFTVTLLRA